MNAFATEVAVIGAGPAGTTSARLLALHGMEVTIIDAGLKQDNRLEIVSPATFGVMRRLGLANLMTEKAIARPCTGIRRRWNSNAYGFDDFLSHPGGCGFVVDRAPFDDKLRQICNEAGANSYSGRVVRVERSARGFVLAVARQGKIGLVHAQTIIDATGRPSSVSRRLGAKIQVIEDLVAERLHVFHSAEGRSQTPVWLEVKSDQDAWSYSVTGPDGRIEVWAIRPNFRCQFRSHLRKNASPSFLYPSAGEGWIAIGDAASAFEPINSQGLMNALNSALLAAGAVATADTITIEMAAFYADAVVRTFAESEIARKEVYAALSH